MALPVAKAGGGKPNAKVAVSTSDKIKVPDEYEARERKYRAQEAAQTLARAADIKKDKALMKDVKGHIKSMIKACD